MSSVFQNIDPPPPYPLASVYTPRLWCGGRTHSLGGKGGGVNILEDARHCSVLYIRKYFVGDPHMKFFPSPIYRWLFFEDFMVYKRLCQEESLDRIRNV
jgi:hypothetical protein